MARFDDDCYQPVLSRTPRDSPRVFSFSFLNCYGRSVRHFQANSTQTITVRNFNFELAVLVGSPGERARPHVYEFGSSIVPRA